ncbi:hypothetical protein KBI33_00610 [Candidatus Shapirobacteria bacterium]|nr:hypothetical protein [Candidatus Shapirobacteria bacterium]
MKIVGGGKERNPPPAPFGRLSASGKKLIKLKSGEAKVWLVNYYLSLKNETLRFLPDYQERNPGKNY